LWAKIILKKSAIFWQLTLFSFEKAKISKQKKPELGSLFEEIELYLNCTIFPFFNHIMRH